MENACGYANSDCNNVEKDAIAILAASILVSIRHTRNSGLLRRAGVAHDSLFLQILVNNLDKLFGR